MAKIFTKTYDTSSKVAEIKVEYPLAIISDTHCNIANVRAVQKKYKNVICLGDITSMFDKEGMFNALSLNHFIASKISCLYGNHEEIVFNHPALEQVHREFIKSLPIGFKLALPNGKHYLCYHNTPKDVWTFFQPFPPNIDLFAACYPISSKTEGVIIGHHHISLTHDYGNIKLIGVGRLAKEGEFVVLTEEGLTHEKV
jgi:predicted phosphodiesterase